MIDRICELLSAEGHVVETFFETSRQIESIPDKIAAFFTGIWSFKARKDIKVKVSEFRPDIVQIQNLYPLISPSILPILNQMGIPVVMRLSNYRLICPSGMFLSKGEVCERCRGGKEYWCVLRNCEGSQVKSIGYALRNWVARVCGLYSKNVTRYYAQTGFQKNSLTSEIISAEQISVIPNMVEAPEENNALSTGSFVGFVGRMSPEKGVHIFLEAARACPEIPFKVAGDPGKFNTTKTLPENVECLGHLEKTQLREFYKSSRFVIVPSQWFEGFPNVIIEAMRQSKPVIASRIGGLPEIVEDGRTGLLFDPGSPSELAEHVSKLWNNPDDVKAYGIAARTKVRDHYNAEIYYEKLMTVYRQAISTNNR